MKTKTTFLFFIITLTFCHIVIAQKISLNEIQTFCSNKNWETTNKTLLAQKWDYYDSEKGDDEHYDIITWAYGRNLYDDSRATGWVYLYNYDGLPNKIMYRFRQKEYYTSIQSQLKTFAYTLTDESIFDERVTATYENKGFVLKIAYNREQDDKDNDDDYGYSSSRNYKKTYTVYEVSIYKKGGVYDPNNGNKKDYDEDGNLIFEYFLRNSKIEGKAKAYDSQGRVTAEYNFKNGEKEGENISYDYLEDSDVYIKSVSVFKNGWLNGKDVRYIVTPEEKYIVSIFNYKEGVAEGKAFYSRKSFIEERNYKEGILNGPYKEYIELKSVLLGGLARIDTLSLPKTTHLEQNYVNGKLNGAIKKYDLIGSLTVEGTYKDSLRTGTWKFYHDNVSDDDGNKLDYAGKLYLISNYEEGKLNGKSEQFSYLEEIKIPCKEGQENEDGCFKYEVVYLHLISYYKNNELNGAYILNFKDDTLFKKGLYLNGLKTGKWIEYTDSAFSNISYEARNFETGVYINGKKQGKWERFDDDGNLLESYTYNNDNIEGKHITYFKGNPIFHKYFSYYGTFKKVEIIKDNNVFRSIEIVSDNSNNYKVIEINNRENFTELQTIKVNKTDKEYEIDPRYFNYEFADLHLSEKIKDGLYELKTTDGKIVSTGNYVNDKKSSIWTDYYYDQNVKTTFTFINGEVAEEEYFDLKKNEPFSGEFIYTNKENNTVEERKIKDGVRHGKTRIKDAKGDTIEKINYKEGIIKE